MLAMQITFNVSQKVGRKGIGGRGTEGIVRASREHELVTSYLPMETVLVEIDLVYLAVQVLAAWSGLSSNTLIMFQVDKKCNLFLLFEDSALFYFSPKRYIFYVFFKM